MQPLLAFRYFLYDSETRNRKLGVKLNTYLPHLVIVSNLSLCPPITVGHMSPVERLIVRKKKKRLLIYENPPAISLVAETALWIWGGGGGLIIQLDPYTYPGFHTGFFEKGGKPSDTPHLPGNSAYY